MNTRERGFLLLCSSLGCPQRNPLTTAQLRNLASRVQAAQRPIEDGELSERDLWALGYSPEMSARILSLLEQQDVLNHYLQKAKHLGLVPVTRVSPGYPVALRKRLGLDSPGVLWAKGDLSILDCPKIALVGSREIFSPNREFAAEAGRQAAVQGYALVSGNARGADRIAQESCLASGGSVICVVADTLADKQERRGVLYLSEDSFDLPFTSLRALSRNRVIHSLGKHTLVAQCSLRTGGTWDGTVKNLSAGWSPVSCFDDGSAASLELEQMGAALIGKAELKDFAKLPVPERNLFEL